MNVSIKDAVVPPPEDERPRAKFAGGWFRHSEMVTWHYYDAPFSWSLCRGDYAHSLAIMQRDDGSSPYCCTGCVIELTMGKDGDEVFISPTDTEIDKLVTALLKNAVEEEIES